jgi:hypothetical protein
MFLALFYIWVFSFSTDRNLGIITPYYLQTKAPMALKFAEQECNQQLTKSTDRQLREAKALFVKSKYSRSNLEKLFRWYLKYADNDSVLLRLEVYLDVNAYNRAQLCDSNRLIAAEPPLPDEPGHELYKKEKSDLFLSTPVAVFSKGSKELVDRPEHLYRFYWYPSISKPETEFIYLKP